MKLRPSVPGQAGVCSESTKMRHYGPPPGACKSASVIRDSEDEERARPQVMCKKQYGSPTTIGTSSRGEPVVGFAVLTNGDVVLATLGGGEIVATGQDIAGLRSGSEFCVGNYIHSCRIAVALNKVYGDIDLLGTGLLIMRDANIIMKLILECHRAVPLLPRTSASPVTWPRDKWTLNGAKISLNSHDPGFYVTFGESWGNHAIYSTELPPHSKAINEEHHEATFVFRSMGERQVAIDFFVQNGALVICERET
ncbi:hypothetical protein Pelo_15225 [Pelomyxa schiedti]|nr:hypothetical protein Pelo_15225 [Pelomyxa schiedti]